MDLTSSFITVSQLGLVPLVIAVVALAKSLNLTGDSSRFAPLYALILGIGGAFLIPSATVSLTIIAGVVLGLTSAGLYSSGKTTFQS